MHFNPDHFLETAHGRVTTPERNRDAWIACWIGYGAALARAEASTVLYLMVGAQGSGKSVQARAIRAAEPQAIVFDAILVKRNERAPLLAAAREQGVPAVAVWMKTPLATCLARNAARPADQVADETGLRNVFAALEPPTVEEGFMRIVEIESPAA